FIHTTVDKTVDSKDPSRLLERQSCERGRLLISSLVRVRIQGETIPMPYTVPVSFDRFVDNISLTGEHHDTADSRRKRVVSLLEKDFTILDSFPTGSIPRYTALKG